MVLRVQLGLESGGSRRGRKLSLIGGQQRVPDGWSRQNLRIRFGQRPPSPTIPFISEESTACTAFAIRDPHARSVVVVDG